MNDNMIIRSMMIDDYEKVYKLWTPRERPGLNNLDD